MTDQQPAESNDKSDLIKPPKDVFQTPGYKLPCTREITGEYPYIAGWVVISNHSETGFEVTRFESFSDAMDFIYSLDTDMVKVSLIRGCEVKLKPNAPTLTADLGDQILTVELPHSKAEWAAKLT